MKNDLQISLFDESGPYNKPYILISIRDDIHEKILHRGKLFEYRKKFISQPCHVFLYISGKTKAICAYAEFGRPVVGSIEKMVSVNAKDRKPNPQGIHRYFQDSPFGFAIPIEAYYEITKIQLEELRSLYKDFTPPQSYIFLDKKPRLLEFLLQKKNSYAHRVI